MKARFWLGVTTLCTPMVAHANGIIPYMVVPLGQAFLLPLVIVIEGLILRRLLGDTFLKSLGQSCVANLASTAVGAALYFTVLPIIGMPLYYWWFRGGFASEAVRNACIALLFAVVLWVLSWIIESLIIARLRKATPWREIWRQCALANLITYVMLLALALLFA